MRIHRLAAGALLLVLSFAFQPAHGQSSPTWVSGAFGDCGDVSGNDCSSASPLRQRAVNCWQDSHQLTNTTECLVRQPMPDTTESCSCTTSKISLAVVLGAILGGGAAGICVFILCCRMRMQIKRRLQAAGVIATHEERMTDMRDERKEERDEVRAIRNQRQQAKKSHKKKKKKKKKQPTHVHSADAAAIAARQAQLARAAAALPSPTPAIEGSEQPAGADHVVDIEMHALQSSHPSSPRERRPPVHVVLSPSSLQPRHQPLWSKQQQLGPSSMPSAGGAFSDGYQLPIGEPVYATRISVAPAPRAHQEETKDEVEAMAKSIYTGEMAMKPLSSLAASNPLGNDTAGGERKQAKKERRKKEKKSSKPIASPNETRARELDLAAQSSEKEEEDVHDVDDDGHGDAADGASFGVPAGAPSPPPAAVSSTAGQRKTTIITPQPAPF